MRSFFWGLFLISSGLFLILKHYFNWNVPAFRIIVGLFLLSLGLSLLFGGWGGGYQDQSSIIFSDGRINVSSGEKDYNIIFGQGTLDFRETPINNINRKVEVNTIFGSSEILLPKEVAVEIEVSSVFSSTELPDGSALSFGDRVYTSDPRGKGGTDMVLEINTVFGNTRIRH